jgi:hypothetical protein
LRSILNSYREYQISPLLVAADGIHEWYTVLGLLFFAATENAVVFTDVARRQQSLTRVAGTCEKPFELVEIVI